MLVAINARLKSQTMQMENEQAQMVEDIREMAAFLYQMKNEIYENLEKTKERRDTIVNVSRFSKVNKYQPYYYLENMLCGRFYFNVIQYIFVIHEYLVVFLIIRALLY